MRWKWNDTSHLKLGFNYKDKNRDYSATRFYYNLNKLNPVTHRHLQHRRFLNQQNIADGQIVVQRVMQPKDSYRAETKSTPPTC